MLISENENALEEIAGTVERIIYKNDENAYTVIDLFDERGELMTAVGIMPYVIEGDTVMLAGKWKNHQTFGKQFEVEYFDRTLPSDETDILRYLSSGAVKGIRAKTAQKIVERYGGETFDIIENHPEWLCDIRGISPKKAQEISDSFREQFGVRNLMLASKGVLSATLSMKIVRRFKAGTTDIIQKNPYVLCEEIDGIGFDKCDKLANIFGIESDSIFRIKSGIVYLLSQGAQKGGHTYLPENDLSEKACTLLSVSKDLIPNALEELENEKKIVSVIENGERNIYSSRYYNAEKYTAEKLSLLDRVCVGVDKHDIKLLIDRIEIENSMTYADLQRVAITDAIEHGVMIITGGPGTGKTTIIRALLRIFENMGLTVSLAAPTGRAAKRMSESTGSEAKTIHRLLEMERRDDEVLSFRRNEDNLLDSDVVVIDEASMLGILLIESLLKAVKPGARLLLIGDASQLPSVGAGNVLEDLIKSERFCTVALTKIFRQAEKSLIVMNAHAIDRGEYPRLSVHDGDFFFLKRQNDMSVADTVVELCALRLPKSYGVEAARGIQVISPTRSGAAGTENLNRVLQERLNPQAKEKNEKNAHGVVFREGDRVMQIRNNYDIEWEKDGKDGVGIFNGDIGRIESINTKDETLIINFDSRIAVYDFSMLDELEHSYAITVHKSQGSEYPIVVLSLATSAPMLLTRNLLYTALTRAQNMVVVVGSEQTVAEMVDNDRRANRYTGLARVLNKS